MDYTERERRAHRKVAREHAKTEISRVLGRSISDREAKQNELARLVGAQPSQMSDAINPCAGRSLQVPELLLMAESEDEAARGVALDVVRHLARALDMHVVDAPEGGSISCMRRGLAEMMEGATALALATADGVIDPAERRTLQKEVREAVEAGQAVLEELEGHGPAEVVRLREGSAA